MSNISKKLFQNGGEMGKLMRSIDWSKTPLGDVDTWPKSLKTKLRTMLGSKFGMFLFWGPEHVQFYNDAYRPSLGKDGGKHPKAMGQRGEDCWLEIWPAIYPQIKQVMTKGIATWHENHLLPIYRNGILEEVYWTYSYSPVFEDSGEVSGVHVVEVETTKQVIGERQTKLLSELAIAHTDVVTIKKACASLAKVLKSYSRDIPFSALYLLDTDREKAQVVSITGFKKNASPFPTFLSPSDKKYSSWHIWDVIDSKNFKVIKNLSFLNPNWPENVNQAIVFPVILPNQKEPLGVFIAGLNPRKLLDDDYRDFLASTVRQIASGLSNAITHELEATRQLELETARARAESASKRLYNLFMQAPAHIAVLRGPDHVFELANPLYMQLVGQRPIVGKSIREALPELKGQGFYELLDTVYKTGKPFFGTELIAKLDRQGNGKFDDSYYFNFVYQPTLDVNENVSGILIHATDVTEQVLARQRIQESEEKYRSLFETMDQGFCLIEMLFNKKNKPIDYRFLELNPIFEKQTGLIKAVGKTALELVPNLEDRWFEIYGKVALTGVSTHFTEGSEAMGRWFEVHAFRIGGQESRKVAILFTDISERKKAEKQKEDFMGIISHELKTPVTSVKAYAQILEARFRKAEDTASAEMLGKMDRQLNKLTSLIIDLLDVTKIDAGELQFREEFFDFNTLIEEIVEEMQPTTVRHKIISKLPVTRSVYGDRDRIGQVVTNFITNAIKYSPNSDRIVISTIVDSENITLRVKDYGVGIAKEDQLKIFERYYRAGGLNQNTYPGLGLGLYISAEIIRRQNGKIWVESEKGKGLLAGKQGSAFYFSLPIKYEK